MISAIRCYQPIQIPGKTNINMISSKQLPDLQEIKRVNGGFIVIGGWAALWGDKKKPFNLFVPDANVQFAYISGIEDIEQKEEEEAAEEEIQNFAESYKAELFTVPELKQLAKARGIIYHNKSKQQLIDDLNANANK